MALRTSISDSKRMNDGKIAVLWHWRGFYAIYDDSESELDANIIILWFLGNFYRIQMNGNAVGTPKIYRYYEGFIGRTFNLTMSRT